MCCRTRAVFLVPQRAGWGRAGAAAERTAAPFRRRRGGGGPAENGGQAKALKGGRGGVCKWLKGRAALPFG